jgi:hypothetical protein
VKYLLMVCVEEPIGPGTPGTGTLGPDTEAWVEEMDGRGVRVLGDRLVEPHRAMTVRVRDGELMVVDGPYAETKEVMGGFDVIECADIDEAVEIASKHPIAKLGMIEVRPFWTR